MDPQKMRSESEQPLIVQRAHELANSGKFEGFNALVPSLKAVFGDLQVEQLRKEIPVKYAITDACQAAWRLTHLEQDCVS